MALINYSSPDSDFWDTLLVLSLGDDEGDAEQRVEPTPTTDAVLPREGTGTREPAKLVA